MLVFTLFENLLLRLTNTILSYRQLITSLQQMTAVSCTLSLQAILGPLHSVLQGILDIFVEDTHNQSPNYGSASPALIEVCNYGIAGKRWAPYMLIQHPEGYHATILVCIFLHGAVKFKPQHI